MKWLFDWEDSGERKLEGPRVFLPGPTKTQFLQIVEMIGEKKFWTFWCFCVCVCVWVLNMFLDVSSFFFFLLLWYSIRFSSHQLWLVFVFIFFRKYFWINFLCLFYFFHFTEVPIYTQFFLSI